MSHQRASLPDERPLLGSGWDLLRSGRPLLVLLTVPLLAGYFWRGLTAGDWSSRIVITIIGAAFGLVVWHGLVTRSIRSTRGTYHRFEHPVHYWINLAIFSLIYAMCIAALFLA